jgi:succinate dehydrogenase / fumarate reductase flavoprotein subunit
MWHQFKELADVDITKEPMEVGPTCHYVMGGVEVDPDTEETHLRGLFAAGEVSGGMHGSNRLGGNSLSDLLVFGRRAGLGAAMYVDALGDVRPHVTEEMVTDAEVEALAPFQVEAGENPYTIHADLQQTMNDLVGIIRTESEMQEALERLQGFKSRVANAGVQGGRAFNPGWHLSLDLKNMLLVAEAVAKSALERTESRGGHTRDDYPTMSPDWRQINIVCKSVGTDVEIYRQPIPPMREDLLVLFDVAELKKYMTEDELPKAAH